MSLELPIVVRLDGTNAEEGRRILAEAAPPNLHVSPTMLEAAKPPWSSRRDLDRPVERARRRRTSSRTRTARARISTGSSSGPPARGTALDVATGGGHVATTAARGRARGRHVRPRARDAAGRRLPGRVTSRSPTRSFDVVACRTAAHHFADVRACGARDGARRRRSRADRRHASTWATRSRRPRSCAIPRTCATTPTRSGASSSWRRVSASTRSRFFAHTFDCSAVARRGRAARARRPSACIELLGERVADGRLTLDKIAIKR